MKADICQSPAEWAEQIWAWRERGLDVYAYLNNTARGHAIKDAQRLGDMLN